ncbi:MAG: STAS domain-containing protein [Gammaproteobacteria bacterium]|nr:STAS domain-containing protein [Gammaproteobacteria bacterium]
MSINISWERSGNLLVAILSGRLDGSNADFTEIALESGIEESDQALVLDFENLSFISSAGIRVIWKFAKRFNGPGKKYALCALTASTRSIIVMSGLNEFIALYDSRSEAVSALEGDGTGTNSEQEM